MRLGFAHQQLLAGRSAASRVGTRAALGCSWLERWLLWSALILCASVACMPYTPSTVNYPADWNHKGIQWRPYALGLRDARRENKPILLIFYTDWCPHCHNYSRVFHDPELVAESQRFIMIRVERDGNRELSAQYDLDGDYIPRTLFLTPDGSVLEGLHLDRSEYRYFLNEYEADETLKLMRQAEQAVKALPTTKPVASPVTTAGQVPSE